MRATALAPVSVLVFVLALLAPSPAVSAPSPVTRDHLLTSADYLVAYPDMRDPSRIVLRSPLFAPRGCDDQDLLVRGTSRILGSVSPSVRRRSVSLIDQNVVRFASVREAKDLLQRYRFFSKRCVGDVDTDDGEGGAVRLKNRAWFPPSVGDQSAGMLIGWFQRGSADWRRVLAVRVGRTVSVLDVSFTDVRPPKDDVVTLGELAAERLG
ncbi:sensor domain-containing protein [Nocardioides eburneiflavus]|uniref:Sensor domain-containing protein n=1 Tax=Nocardioides eburneiflavus TaxID=2518372 RepID=A0A4Z1CHQ0_9ACTN|nr:sensor domain-containing protein [Nocardioides eburneiflavus]TGN66295.1 sensor domain-containing protein [Nocardioides eburneiflavus]